MWALVFALAQLPAYLRFAQGATLQQSGIPKCDLHLEANLPSSQPVGTTITLSATCSCCNDFRFDFFCPSERRTLLRDFDTLTELSWTHYSVGHHRIRVTGRDAMSGEVYRASLPFTLTPRAFGNKSVVSPTYHPLVALYSAPACNELQKVRVQFRVKGTEPWTATPWKICEPRVSVNQLVAGMLAETTYEMRHQTARKNLKRAICSSDITCFTTGPIQQELLYLPFDVIADSPGVSTNDQVLLHSSIFNFPNSIQSPACPVATDLEGNVIWYYILPCLLEYAGSLMNSLPGSGETFVLHMTRPAEPFPVRGQILRTIDLAGNIVQETNVERINEQLKERCEEPIYYFHHDTHSLPNGHMLVMAGVERITKGIQEPLNETIDIVGDVVLDLDENLQVVWVWNGLNHFPLTRQAIRDELCSPIVCGPLRKANEADRVHDWTHGNTVTYTPKDGNFIVSFAHQDLVIKVDYRDGHGTGDVVWCLGMGGDFTLVDKLTGLPESQAWFSGQHQPLVYNGDHDEIVIYDNANALNEPFDPANVVSSRGQAYILDETNMLATLRLNADLGVYAAFVGSSQKLSNGNYHFLSGGAYSPACSAALFLPGCFSQSTEVDPNGEIVYTLENNATVIYRSFRMRSLYELARPYR